MTLWKNLCHSIFRSKIYPAENINNALRIKKKVFIAAKENEYC